MSGIQEFQKLVIANASNAKGLSVGTTAPDFTLPNALGKKISLYEKLRSKIVLIKFYRGEWCPICNLDLRQVQKHLPQIEDYGVSVLAISPQNPDSALTAKEKNHLGFEVLSDSRQEVIRAYKLQFDPGFDYHDRRDLTELNGDGSKTLPVPATFIVDRSHIIRAAHIEADYTQRMKLSEIFRALENMKDEN